MSKVNFWFEKNAVKKRLEVTIGTSSKKINGEAGCDLLPHGVEIKWDVPQNRDAFLERGKMVVVLEPSINEERNLARAALMYIKEDLIAASQRFIDVTVMKSLVFAMARKMLMLDRRLGALKCLNSEFIEPEAARTPSIRDYVSGMENIDKFGFLTRILLREFSKLEAELPPVLSDPEAAKETERLTQLLKHFAERKENEDVPLSIEGSIFRMNIMPVAKILTFDVSHFVNRASTAHADDINTIYAVALGANVELARIVVEEIEKAKLYNKKVESEYKIMGRKNTHIRAYVSELSKL